MIRNCLVILIVCAVATAFAARLQQGREFPSGVVISGAAISCNTSVEGLLMYDPSVQTTLICDGEVWRTHLVTSGSGDTNSSEIALLREAVRRLGRELKCNDHGDYDIVDHRCICHDSNEDGHWSGEGCEACKEGWEGSDCTVDIDECALDQDNCDQFATCNNTPGSFSCVCNDGYGGSGVECEECPTGSAGVGGTCTQCPDGTSPSPSRTSCDPCFYSPSTLDAPLFSTLCTDTFTTTTHVPGTLACMDVIGRAGLSGSCGSQGPCDWMRQQCAAKGMQLCSRAEFESAYALYGELGLSEEVGGLQYAPTRDAPATYGCDPDQHMLMQGFSGSVHGCHDDICCNRENERYYRCCGDVPYASSAGTGGICQPCTDGFHPNENRTACEECPPGTYGTRGLCYDTCAAGTGPTSLRTSCTPCPVTHFSSEGVGICTQCPNGNQPTSTQAECEPCPNGSAGIGGACEVCSEGGTGPNEERTECVECEVGEYSAGDGICQLCADGEQPDAGRLGCEPCPSGTVGTGGQCLISCTPGFQPSSSRTTCEPCLGATVSVDGSQCLACDIGAEPNSNRTACHECPAGSFRGSNDVFCEQCPDGSGVNDLENPADCVPCAQGTAGVDGVCSENCGDGSQQTSDRTTCEDCAPGYAGTNGVCSQCADGSQPNESQTSCVECATGFAGTGGFCHLCADGTEPAVERTQCVTCTLSAASCEDLSGDMVNIPALGVCIDRSSTAGISGPCTSTAPCDWMRSQCSSRGLQLCSRSEYETAYSDGQFEALGLVHGAPSSYSYGVTRDVGLHGCSSSQHCCCNSENARYYRCCGLAHASGFAGTSGQCARCADGFEPNNNRTQCIACSAGYAGVGGVCSTRCPAGTEPSADRSTCDVCAAGTYSGDGVACISCPDGSYPSADQRSCNACPAGTVGTGGSCSTTCDAGTAPNQERTACVSCTSTQASSGTECVDCGDGYEPSSDSSACIECPFGTAGTGGTCEACPENTSPIPDRTACANCGLGMDGQPLCLDQPACSGPTQSLIPGRSVCIDKLGKTGPSGDCHDPGTCTYVRNRCSARGMQLCSREEAEDAYAVYGSLGMSEQSGGSHDYMPTRETGICSGGQHWLMQGLSGASHGCHDDKCCNRENARYYRCCSDAVDAAQTPTSCPSNMVKISSLDVCIDQVGTTGQSGSCSSSAPCDWMRSQCASRGMELCSREEYEKAYYEYADLQLSESASGHDYGVTRDKGMHGCSSSQHWLMQGLSGGSHGCHDDICCNRENGRYYRCCTPAT